ncbi:hypothetical protein EIN_250290 [Entamoeba invadens IP1]|uniref:Uncharacterized protein n=1 Tax=Entamoeba invadens IP1 TaxID=370355 RepID=A0A0A1UEC4_ENTIV|nr:hypothetical protein EIN_250290 [Entamoeba invadens IP1]ELP94935.1 hypothetical protein EIN_250290 [Entamoeba invadens IP1]|eukprot:XP_004261706.1 hypothetical protein EIN_250290 [Entamoeba invadens IP1]
MAINWIQIPDVSDNLIIILIIYGIHSIDVQLEYMDLTKSILPLGYVTSPLLVCLSGEVMLLFLGILIPKDFFIMVAIHFTIGLFLINYSQQNFNVKLITSFVSTFLQAYKFLVFYNIGLYRYGIVGAIIVTFVIFVLLQFGLLACICMHTPRHDLSNTLTSPKAFSTRFILYLILCTLTVMSSFITRQYTLFVVWGFYFVLYLRKCFVRPHARRLGGN